MSVPVDAFPGGDGVSSSRKHDIGCGLMCPWCDEPFHSEEKDSDHAPISLNCGCTFCATCVSGVMSDEGAECGRCNTKITSRIPNHSLGALGEVVFVLDGEAQVQPAVCHECNAIGDEVTPASFQCMHEKCKQRSLCEEHGRFHQKRGHSLLSLDGSTPFQRYCERHPKIPLEYHCTSEEVDVCAKCLLTSDHQGHEILRLDDLHKVLSELRQACNNSAESAAEAVELLTQHKAKLTDMHDHSIRKALAIVSRTVEAVVNKCKNSMFAHMKPLDTQITEWSVTEGQLSAVVHLAEKGLASESVVEVSKLMRDCEVMSGLRDKCFTDPVVNDCPVLTVYEGLLQAGLQRAIRQHNSNVNVCKSTSSISGVGLTTFVSGDASVNVIDVIARDADGRAMDGLTESDIVFDAFRVSDDGDVDEFHSVLKDVHVEKHDGRFRIIYDVYDVGTIAVWIGVGGCVFSGGWPLIVEGTSVSSLKIAKLEAEQAQLQTTVAKQATQLRQQSTSIFNLETAVRRGIKREAGLQYKLESQRTAMAAKDAQIRKHCGRIEQMNQQSAKDKVTIQGLTQGCERLTIQNRALQPQGPQLAIKYGQMKQQMDRNRKLDQERGQGKETIGELLLERSKHQTDLATLQRQHSEVSAHCQQTEAKLIEARKQLESLRAELAACKQEVEMLQTQLADKTKQISSATTETQLLTEKVTLQLRQINGKEVQLQAEKHVVTSLTEIMRWVEEAGGKELLVANAQAVLNTLPDDPANSEAELLRAILPTTLSSERASVVLLAISKKSPLNVEDIRQLRGIMHIHSSDASVQKSGCSAIDKLAVSEENRVPLVSEGCLDSIFCAMDMHSGNADVISSASRALWKLSINDEARQSIVTVGGIEKIMRAMDDHEGNADVQWNACGALANLAFTHKKFALSGGLAKIFRAMDAHLTVAGVQEQACRTLRALANVADVRTVIFAEGGLARVLNAMERHMGSAGVQEKGCGALRNMGLGTEQDKIMIVEESGVEAILRAMDSHVANAGVQSSGCGALWSLATVTDNASKIIAEGGLEKILRAMDTHAADADVQHNACGAIHNLALVIEDDTIKRTLLEKVLKAMDRHPGHIGVQERGCWALLNIAGNNKELLKTIADGGGVKKVRRAMATHPTSTIAQSKGKALLTNLGISA